MNIYVCIWEENIFPLATDQIRFVMPNVSAELCVFLGDGVQLLAFGGLFSAHLRFFFSVGFVILIMVLLQFCQLDLFAILQK